MAAKYRVSLMLDEVAEERPFALKGPAFAWGKRLVRHGETPARITELRRTRGKWLPYQTWTIQPNGLTRVDMAAAA